MVVLANSKHFPPWNIPPGIFERKNMRRALNECGLKLVNFQPFACRIVAIFFHKIKPGTFGTALASYFP